MRRVVLEEPITRIATKRLPALTKKEENDQKPLLQLNLL